MTTCLAIKVGGVWHAVEEPDEPEPGTLWLRPQIDPPKAAG